MYTSCFEWCENSTVPALRVSRY